MLGTYRNPNTTANNTAEIEQTVTPGVNPNTEVKEVEVNAPISPEGLAGRIGAKKIWDYFKKRGQVTQDFETWYKRLKENKAGQDALYRFGKGKGFINQDFNTWKNKLTGYTGKEEVTIFGENVDESSINNTNAANNWSSNSNNIVSQIEELRQNPILFTQEDVNNGLAKPDQIGYVNVEATNNKIKNLSDQFPNILEFDNVKARDFYISTEQGRIKSEWEDLAGEKRRVEDGVYTKESDRNIQAKIDFKNIKDLEKLRGDIRTGGVDSWVANKEILKTIAENGGMKKPENFEAYWNEYNKGDIKGDTYFSKQRNKFINNMIKGFEKNLNEMGIGAGPTMAAKTHRAGYDSDVVQGTAHTELTDVRYSKTAQDILKEKLKKHQSGEEIMETNELKNVVKVNPEAVKYVKSLYPEIDLDTDELETYTEVVNKATLNDPRFQAITQEVHNNLGTKIQDKYIELSRAFDTRTQEGLELAQKEFQNWYTTEFNTALGDNPEAKKLFQSYGIAASEAGTELFEDFARSQTPELAWIDAQLEDATSDSLGDQWTRGRMRILESLYKADTNVADVFNNIEIGLNDLTGTLQKRANVVEEIQFALDNDLITKDTTLGEARRILNQGSNNLDAHLKINDWIWSDDDTIGDYLERKEERLANSEKRVAEDIEQKINYAEELSKYRQTEGGGFNSLEDVLNSIAGGIDQAPQFVPKAIGYTLYGAGWVSGNPALMMGGKAAIALSALTAGAQSYGSSFMEALENRMIDKYGEDGFTTEEYLQALKEGLGGKAQAGALGSGFTVGGTELLGDIAFGKIGGGLAKTVFAKPFMREAVKNSFWKFIINNGARYATLKGSGLKEAITEGFQSYLEQGFTNLASGYDSPFSQNISFDQIITEAKAGYQMGHLFGVGGISGNVAGNYFAQANQIAKNIDMSPESSTFLASDKYFDQLVEDVKKNKKLTQAEKDSEIQSISDIRNASIKVPKTITGDTKSTLIDLLVEKAGLERKIKQVNDKDISATDIARKDAISAEIQTIVDNANVELALDKNVNNVRQIIHKSSKGKITIDEVADAKEANAFAKSERLQGWKTKYSSNQGTILQNPKTGEQKIIINRDQAIKDQAVNVAGHEFLHGLLFETVKNSPETAINIGNALDSELKKLKLSEDSKYYKRLEKYKDNPEAHTAEEKLTLFSDALAAGDIKFDENIFTQIGDNIRRALQAVGLKGIKFNNGRDVYNFIKDFNNSIEKGKLNMAQAKLLTEKAEGELIADEVIDTDTKAKGSVADVNRRFAEKKWAKDLKKSKDNIDTQFGAGTVATIKPNTKWETFKKRQIEKGIDWDGQIAANDETRMQRDFEAVQRDLKEQQKEAKGREYRKTLKGLERIDQELVAISGMVDEGWWDKTDPRYKQHNDLRRRRKKIQKLEIENDANELRAKLKKATGENRENIEIALEEKFKKLPQAVKDAGIDIYTGKPVDEVTAKAAKGETVKKSKKLTDLIKEYKEGNFENVEDLAIQYQKVGKDAVKRWAAQRGVPINLGDPQVDKEVTSLLNKEFDSFVRNFDPEVSEASTYMNQIAKRVGTKIVEESARKDKQVSQDVLTEKGVSPKTTTQKDFDETKDTDRGRKKKYPSSLSEVRKKITEGLANEIIGGIVDGRPTGLAKDIISGLAKNIDPEAVAKSVIAQTKDKTVMQRLREAIGKWGTKAYNDFVDKIIDQGLVDTIPAATIKRRLGFQRNVDAGLINYKKIGKTKQIKVKDGKKTYSTPDVYSITKLDKEKLKDYYKDNEKRQQSLFSMLTEGVMAEGLQTLRNDKAFMDRLRTALELKKSPLTADEFMDGLEQKLDQRTKEDTSLDEVTVKSSKAWTGGDQQSFEDQMGYVPVGRDWLEQLAIDKGKPSWWYKLSVKENRERFRGIEDLETQYSADELRNKIKKAKGAAKTDLILALEMKFEKFPELVEDSEIDIYTGKPLDKVIAKSAQKDADKKSKVEQAKSYTKRGLAADARSKPTDMVDDPLVIKKGKPLSKADQKRRKVGTIVAYHKLGPEFHTGNTLFGSTEYSVYQTKAEADADLNAPLDADTITQFKEEGIPTITKKDGKTYYDKSKAKGVDIKLTDKNGNEIVHKKGGSMTTSRNIGKPISTIQEAQNEQMGGKRKDGTGGAYKNWSIKELMKHVRDPNWRQLQINKLKVLKNIAKTIAADIKANPERAAYWAAWLNSQLSQSNHPIRALAPIKFFSRIMNPGKLGFVAEHTLPANQVSSMILGMAKRNTVNRDFKDIERDYYQGKITKKQDGLLKGEGYNYISTMPQIFFDLLNPSTWLRYLNKSVNARKGGINTNQILVWNNEGEVQTLAESFGVGLTPAQYNMPKGGPRAGRVNQNLIQEQNNMLYDMFVKGEPTATEIKQRLTANYNLKTQRAKTDMVAKSSKGFGDQIFDEEATSTAHKETMLNSLKTRVLASKPNRPAKGISIFDFDDTLAKTKEKVIVTMPDGKVKEISASQFAKTADILVEGGASFDFSNFEKVAKGTKKGPLADIALKRQGKFGSGDIFVLTARPQSAAPAIKQFLDSIGLDIPLENITGLADGTAQAKVDFVLNKTAEGYNDFYFADDSIPNVKAVKEILNEIDVKSDTVIAKASKQDSLSEDFNNQIEEVTGKEAFKKYSDVRGRLEGKRKDAGLFKKFLKQFTITPSAEDFMGLMYDLIGKGEKGNRHMKFIKDNLIDPYNKAEQELLSAKVAVANDFEALKKKFPTLRSTVKGNPLMSEIGVGPYTKSQAVRVYNWAKQGLEIPGISKADVNRLVKAVETDPELNIFADELGLINKDGKYPAPENNWLAGDISSDLLRSVDTVLRTELMSEFNENVDIIFSEENKNKLRALYGNKWVEALEDSIRRMKSGSNRPVYIGGGSRIVNNMLDWLNGSVGAVMFINVKSGLLQLISNVNFINWGDNNIYAAAKAFVSADYWPTVMKLLNSDYLVNRRDGLKINVNEAELADAGRKGGIKGAISYLLDKGFIITRIMDSLAIATGGATFYINRVKSLLNRVNPETGKKYTQAEAEAKAFDDFYAISEESQQSSNPSKISQQQASMFGRVILSFQNVTMQYNRLTKKAIRDLYNRRKMPGMTQRESDLSNISKIVYYTTVQNLVFNALQQAIFALAFNDEGDEEEKDKTADILHGMADSLLFGLGFGGAIISTVKNVAREILSQSERKSPDYEEAVWEVFNISPVLDSKVRKLRTTAKTYSWNMEDIKKRGWSLDNPSYLAISQLISAATNIPIDRVMRKVMNMRQAMDDNTRTWQRIALMLGYSGWSLGLPYWGLESTITREAEEKEKIQNQYKIDIKRLKNQGYKRIPLTGKKSWANGIPKNMKLNRDYIQVERPTGIIEYWLTPKNKKK